MDTAKKLIGKKVRQLSTGNVGVVRSASTLSICDEGDQEYVEIPVETKMGAHPFMGFLWRIDDIVEVA